MHDLRTPMLDAPPLVRYGLPEYCRGTTPAAGAMFSEDVDGAYFQRLLSVHVRLVTDANVANRTVAIEYRDGDDARYLLCGAPVDQTASTTTDWIFSAWQGQAEWSVDSSVIVPLTPIIQLPTHSWRIFVDNVQAGDALSLIRYTRERFYTQPT